jgi:hypothetical protein
MNKIKANFFHSIKKNVILKFVHISKNLQLHKLTLCIFEKQLLGYNVEMELEKKPEIWKC